jgi:hypothetical protein
MAGRRRNPLSRKAPGPFHFGTSSRRLFIVW